MARYTLLRRAQSDLRGIRVDNLRDNPAPAVTSVDEPLGRCQLLAHSPLTGRARPELRPGPRSLPHGDYLIFYRPLRDDLSVVRVLHGSREAGRLL